MKKMTKTLPGYPPLLLLQASHPVQVHHLLHLCSGSWSSSFAFLPIWPFSLGLDFGWKLGRQFLVSALEPFSPQAFLASSFSTLYQGLLKDFAARLSQQDSPPRLDQFVLHTHPQHHHCWPPSPLWQMVPPKEYFLKKMWLPKTEPTWSYFLKYSKILTTKQQCWDGTDYWVLVL